MAHSEPILGMQEVQKIGYTTNIQKNKNAITFEVRDKSNSQGDPKHEQIIQKPYDNASSNSMTSIEIEASQA